MHDRRMTASTPGFVLVHGGEHGGWCWDRVVPLLEWPAIAVDLPGRGARPGDLSDGTLAGNAAHLVRAIDQAGFDPFVLVCHSLGGLTVLAAEPLHNLRPSHRVFVSALGPVPGTAGLDALPALFRWFLRVRLRRPVAAGRAVHLLPRWLAIRKWCRGLSRADQRLILSRLCPEPARIPLDRTPVEFAGAATSTYVVLEQDRAMAAGLQRRMAANLDICELRTIEAGHEAMFSHPRELASELNAIGRKAFLPLESAS